MSGDEDFALAVAVEIGNDRRRETLAFELDRVLVGEMHPRLSEGEIALMLRSKGREMESKSQKNGEMKIKIGKLREGD